jgi:hypothetical protein
MAFYDEDAVFWTGIATMSFAFFGLIIKSCLTSKCDRVSLCYGLINIHRAVELEDIEHSVETPEIEEIKR